MSYRVLRKTTKKTEYKCLKCSCCQIVYKTAVDVKIKCTASEKSFMDEFSARQFTCNTFININELTEREKETITAKKIIPKNKFELKGEDAKKYEQKSIFENLVDKAS